MGIKSYIDYSYHLKKLLEKYLDIDIYSIRLNDRKSQMCKFQYIELSSNLNIPFYNLLHMC